MTAVKYAITGWAAVFAIVGLPEKAVAESRERVRGALNAIRLALPPEAHHRQSGAPADLPKELGRRLEKRCR